MPPLVGQLAFDLKQRCSFLAAVLRDKEAGLASPVDVYCARMAERLERTGQLIENLISDPRLRSERLIKNAYQKYKRLAEFVQEAEWGPVVALQNFGEGDLFLSRLVQRMCREFAYPYDAPLCSTLSSSYFWASPSADLIFVPTCESCHLLCLPRHLS